MSEQLRAYFFQNMYLQGIHAGIQSLHTTADMFCKYSLTNCLDQPMAKTLHQWADFHKTTIVLNGGYSSNLERIVALLESEDHEYPWAYFCESSEALNGAITNVGIILPEKVFDYEKQYKYHASLRSLYTPQQYNEEHGISSFEYQLAKEVSQCKLMS